MSFGRRTAEAAIAKRLGELFPRATELDFSVISKEVVHASDLAAVRMVDEREQALQRAMRATMDYFAEVVEALRERVVELERDLTAQRLRQAQTVVLRNDEGEQA